MRTEEKAGLLPQMTGRRTSSAVRLVEACRTACLWIVLISILSAAGLTQRSAQADALHLSAGCKQRKGQVGVVQTVQKGLSIRHGLGAWQKARKGSPVAQKDSLRTAKGARARVQMCSGGSLYLNARSQVAVQSPLAAEVKTGEVWALSPAGKQRQVKTAHATATGASFDVRVSSGRSRVVGVAGSVSVKNRKGSVVLQASQATVVKKNVAPARPTTVDVQRVTGWTTQLGSWTVLTAPNLLSEPRHIALAPDGTLIVADEYNHRVVKLSSSGKLLAAWTATNFEGSSAAFSSPYGVAVDGAGNIYVADEGLSIVQKLSPSGAPLAIIAEACTATSGCGTVDQPGVILGPEGVAVDGQGNVYVADTTFNRIQKFSPTGASLQVLGTNGSGPGQFSLPGGVAVDAAGNIYVADSINNRIQKLSPQGQVLSVWGGTRGSGVGQFDGPDDVTVAPDGNVYVADSGNNRIQELTPDGRPIQTLGSGGTGPGQFISPEGVVVDAAGTIYVVDRSNGRVQRYAR